MARKEDHGWKTMQQRMYHMRTLMLQLSIRLHRHLLWQKLLTSGLHREEPISSDRPYRLPRCSLRLEQQVLFTDLWQQVL